MATITIRELPDDLLRRLKASAKAHGRSMEQEVRELLAQRYAPRSEILDRIRERWDELPETDAEEAARWRAHGRP